MYGPSDTIALGLGLLLQPPGRSQFNPSITPPGGDLAWRPTENTFLGFASINVPPPPHYGRLRTRCSAALWQLGPP